jgi:ferredoxin
MKVEITPGRCQGHQRCVALAPELFVSDDLGFAEVVDDGTVAPSLADKARLAEMNCPELAIAIYEGDPKA